jgi:hypothetical protein
MDHHTVHTTATWYQNMSEIETRYEIPELEMAKNFAVLTPKSQHSTWKYTHRASEKQTI